MYKGMITDPFYKKPEVLKRMSVSQGVLHPADLPEVCDTLFCYKKIENNVYEEVSLVFHPGFSIATLSIENEQPYNIKQQLQGIMENNTKKTTEGDCGCGKSKEVDQASGVMSEAGNCGEGKYWDTASESCKPVDESGKAQSNAGSKGVASVPGHEALEKAEAAVKKASIELEEANEAVTKARKAAEKEEMDVPKGEESPEEATKKEKTESKKNSTESHWAPNQDTGSRAKAQMEYNKALEAKYAAVENQQKSILQLTRANMEFAKEHASRNAKIGTDDTKNGYTKAIETAHVDVKKWIDSLIKSPETAQWHKTWKLNDNYLDQFVVRKYKSLEGQFLYDKFTPIATEEIQRLKKAVESTDVSMNGGTATGDAFNWQRTLSELVLVYPDGRIITPIQQFCESAILLPGKAQHIFYSVNVPTFAATDEANMDAGNSGYALAPSEIVIEAAGGSTTAQGTLVRIGFTQLEEIPIDLIQKINIGMAMEAEDRKNFAVLNTCYNDDTAYNPATDSIMPKGGGNKGAADGQGNTHWINGNTGAQLTSTDAGATSQLKYKALLDSKGIIGTTGLDVSNLKMYLPYNGILQIINDPDISTYIQRSVPEVVTEGYIEKISGVDLIAASQTADGLAANVKRAVVFIPTVSFGFVTGRELQVDAERVARQQSVFTTASMKVGAFCKKYESTCRVSFAATPPS